MSEGTRVPAVSAPVSETESGSARMIVTMGGIGLICGILIVLTYQLTLPVINRNKAEALERAIFEVVPGAVEKAVFERSGDKLIPSSEASASVEKYYACYDAERQLVGVAVEASGQGFQDAIHILYGYSPDGQTIVGMKVLESRETPGLGDKIGTDANFRKNFDALLVQMASGGAGLEHPIELVKPGKKTNPWQIEAITGATISSRAVTSILQQSTAAQLPPIRHNLDVLEVAP